MKVSIITATYNSERTIKDNIISVKQQTFKDLEHIIIDGASDDKTLQISQFYGHKGPVVSEGDSGIYHAMNKGLTLAKGEIIGILNSDDFYSDAKVIENVIKAFEDKSVDAVYGDLLFVDANNLKTVNRRWIAGDYNKKSFYRGWMPPHPTFFVRREVYERFGQFNLNLKSSSDYELVLRFMLLHKIKVQYLPGVMIHMREGGYSNRSLYNRIAAHREDYLAWKLIGLAPKWYTVTMKPLRKIRQFATGDKSYTLNPFSFDPFLCHVWDGELSNSQTNLKTSGNSLNASSTES